MTLCYWELFRKKASEKWEQIFKLKASFLNTKKIKFITVWSYISRFSKSVFVLKLKYFKSIKNIFEMFPLHPLAYMAEIVKSKGARKVSDYSDFS